MFLFVKVMNKTMLLPARSAAGSSAGIVFYSRADFWVFRPAGTTRCTDQGKIWQGGADGPLLRVGRRPLWCIVELLPKDIASAFLGRFR